MSSSALTRGAVVTPSQLMVDKLFTAPIQTIGSRIGTLAADAMAELDLALRSWLELA